MQIEAYNEMIQHREFGQLRNFKYLKRDGIVVGVHSEIDTSIPEFLKRTK